MTFSNSENSYTICYRNWIFSNHGGMLQNTICLCNFIVYGSCCRIPRYHACWQRWSYITIGEHISITTDEGHRFPSPIHSWLCWFKKQWKLDLSVHKKTGVSICKRTSVMDSLNHSHQGMYTVSNIWKNCYIYFNHAESNHCM